MVECVLNQEVAVIEYTVYNGTEEGIVLHSAQPTSFISEVLLFSLKKEEKKKKNHGESHILPCGEVKPKQRKCKPQTDFFTLIYKSVFSFSSPCLIFP